MSESCDPECINILNRIYELKDQVEIEISAPVVSDYYMSDYGFFIEIDNNLSVN